MIKYKEVYRPPIPPNELPKGMLYTGMSNVSAFGNSGKGFFQTFDDWKIIGIEINSQEYYTFFDLMKDSDFILYTKEEMEFKINERLLLEEIEISRHK